MRVSAAQQAVALAVIRSKDLAGLAAKISTLILVAAVLATFSVNFSVAARLVHRVVRGVVVMLKLM